MVLNSFSAFLAGLFAIISSVADDDLLELRQSKGKHAQILCDMCKFYRDWHVKSDGVYGNFSISVCLSL